MKIHKAIDGLLSKLEVFVAIRAIDTEFLTVEDCEFDYNCKAQGDVFAVGILAAGHCRDLVVRDNRFLSDPAMLSRDVRPIRSLLGFMLVPVACSRRRKHSDKGHGIHLSTLTDAVFRNNRFDGLSAAVLVAANTGTVAVENNVVTRSYSGFWFLPLDGLSLLEAMAAMLSRDKAQELELPPGDRIIATIVKDTLFQYGATIARIYPVPAGYTPVTVSAPIGEAPTVAAQVDLVQAVYNRWITEITATTASSAPRPTGANAKSRSTSKQTERAAIELATNALHQAVFDVERSGLLQEERQPEQVPAAFALTFNGNNVTAVAVSGGPAESRSSSLAFFALADGFDSRHAATRSKEKEHIAPGGDSALPEGTLSSLVIYGNKLQNNMPEVAVAAVIRGERCAVTGNLFLSEVTTRKQFALSLVLLGPPRGVAVTGNVFGSTPLLPQRPNSVLAWVDLNATL